MPAGSYTAPAFAGYVYGRAERDLGSVLDLTRMRKIGTVRSARRYRPVLSGRAANRAFNELRRPRANGRWMRLALVVEAITGAMDCTLKSVRIGESAVGELM